MAKAKTSAFFCQNCGYESSKWMGQCPACREWNTFVEELVDRKALSTSGKIKPATEAKPVPLSAIKTSDEERISTSMPELDRVLGGGVVKGSLVLVGGDPGIGKSTLLLQVCRNLSGQNLSVLYVSGEESLQQIKLRAERIGTFSDHLELLCETSLDTIRPVIERNKPQIVVIDSIQTMYNENVSSAPKVIPYYTEPEALELGSTTIEQNGLTFQIYDKERMICDCLKYEAKLDRAIFREAVQSYIRDNDKDISMLMEYARARKVTGKVQSLIGVWL